MKIDTHSLFDELEKIAIAGPNGAKPGMSFHHWATAVFKPLKTKKASVLTEASRDKIKKKNFAEPGKKKYPIEDESHARNALARVSQFGSSSEKAEVRSKVHSKYPDIGEKSAGLFKSPKADLVGLGMLGVPVAHKLLSSESSKKEKAMAGIEGAGLGTLAAHTLSNMGKHAAPAMSSMMNMHRLADAAKAAKSAKLSGPSMIQGALRSNPNNIARATHLQGQTATGGLPFTPKKPIPL